MCEELTENQLGFFGVVLVHLLKVEVHLRGWWMCWLMWWGGGSFCTDGMGFVWATWAAAGVKSLSPWGTRAHGKIRLKLKSGNQKLHTFPLPTEVRCTTVGLLNLKPQFLYFSTVVIRYVVEYRQKEKKYLKKMFLGYIAVQKCTEAKWFGSVDAYSNVIKDNRKSKPLRHGVGPRPCPCAGFVRMNHLQDSLYASKCHRHARVGREINKQTEKQRARINKRRDAVCVS